MTSSSAPVNNTRSHDERIRRRTVMVLGTNRYETSTWDFRNVALENTFKASSVQCLNSYEKGSAPLSKTPATGHMQNESKAAKTYTSSRFLLSIEMFLVSRKTKPYRHGWIDSVLKVIVAWLSIVVRALYWVFFCVLAVMCTSFSLLISAFVFFVLLPKAKLRTAATTGWLLHPLVAVILLSLVRDYNACVYLLTEVSIVEVHPGKRSVGG